MKNEPVPAAGDSKSQSKSAFSNALLMTAVQFTVWLSGAFAFLLLDSALPVPPILNVIYALLLLFVLVAIPSLYSGPARLDPIQYPQRFNRFLRERLQDFLVGCRSPGIIFIELLALTGNLSTWVVFEPILLFGDVPPSCARDIDPLPESFPDSQVTAFTVSKGTDDRVVDLHTPRGIVVIKTNNAKSAPKAVLAVGGVGGGFDSPANGLYDRLSGTLEKQDISFIDVSFSQPGNFLQSVYELRAAIQYARRQGAKQFVLIGHSFGGGVVVSTALREPAVSCVISLSGQTFGADRVNELAPRRLHLVHGFFDFIVPRCAAERMYRAARQPKDLRLVPATHLLNEAADEVFHLVHEQVANDNNR